jgi:hypothetical protein
VGRWNDLGAERGSGLFLFVDPAAETLALEFDAMSIVNDAIQYGISERRVGNNVVPLLHGHLTCDQERSSIVAIIDDFEEIAALLGCERLGSPVVDDDEICAFQQGHQARKTSFAARLGEICEQA